MTIGIYILKFTGTDRVYVGQSTNIEMRYTKHKTMLRNGYSNYKLKEMYNLYGIPTLDIIYSQHTYDRLTLDERENYYIKEYRAVEHGLNINSTAGGGGGTGLQGEVHGNSRYTNEQITQVFKLLCESDNSFLLISEYTGVSIHTIRDISKGKTHKWLSEKYPEKYLIMLELIGLKSKNTAKDQGIIYPLILSPEGKEFSIANLSAFARENDLNKSHLSGVLNKLRKSHKGWKLK